MVVYGKYAVTLKDASFYVTSFFDFAAFNIIFLSMVFLLLRLEGDLKLFSLVLFYLIIFGIQDMDTYVYGSENSLSVMMPVAAIS